MIFQPKQVCHANGLLRNFFYFSKVDLYLHCVVFAEFNICFYLQGNTSCRLVYEAATFFPIFFSFSLSPWGFSTPTENWIFHRASGDSNSFFLFFSFPFSYIWRERKMVERGGRYRLKRKSVALRSSFTIKEFPNPYRIVTKMHKLDHFLWEIKLNQFRWCQQY